MSARKLSAAAVPGLSRAATAGSGGRGPVAYIYDEEDFSRSESRRSDSRRDLSPPSAHLYRSMAGSRRSSRTSLSDSDSDTGDTTSTQDEKAVQHSKHTPPQAPPLPRVPKPPKSRREVIYEEDAPVERRERRSKSARPEKLVQEEERRIPRPASNLQEIRYPEEIERRREHPRSKSKPRQEEAVYEVESEAETPPKPRRGEVIYEEDAQVAAKYNPFLEGPRTQSRGPSRAPSRAPSIRPEKHSSSGKDCRGRRAVEDAPSRSQSRHQSSKRLTGRYYETEVAYHNSSRRSPTRKARTTIGSNVTSSQSAHSAARRPPFFLGAFFGPAMHLQHHDRPVKLVECVICMEDDIPSHKAAKLKCGHRMCNSCLKESFRLSVRDPQHMPPRCCTADHIPVEHVDRLFDTAFKKQWNRKYAEFSTRNRIYCPARHCGEWIKPENIYRNPLDGRRYAKCGRCHTKVCYTCNGRWHGNRDCPRDEETARFLEQAKRKGWQRCHRCKAMVELKEGCNHMTCRCGAEFCMICGSKWKTCDCPWFSQDAVEADRLEHMRIPVHIRDRPLTMTEQLLFDAPPPLSSPRDFRPTTASPAAAVRPRPQSYEEEILIRRLQEQQGERLARRMHALGHYDDEYDEDDLDDNDDDYHGRIGEIHGIGHAAGHHMNDDYRRRPETLIVPPAPHTEPRVQQHQPLYDRTTTSAGTDYVSGVHRARGVPQQRANSMERRLADRFNSDLRGGLPVRHGSGPLPPPPPPMLKTAATMPVMPMPPMVPPPGVSLRPAPHHASPPGITPVRRRHTMEDEMLYSSPLAQLPRPSPAGRTRVHRRTDDFEAGGPDDDDEYLDGNDVRRMPTPPFPPPVREEGGASARRPTRRNKASRQHRREPEEEPKSSRLAGLTGPGRGMDRVFEWVNYVEDGPPPVEDGEEGKKIDGSEV